MSYKWISQSQGDREQATDEMNGDWCVQEFVMYPPGSKPPYLHRLFAMAQYPYGICSCLVQHSVFPQLNLGKHNTWLLPGKGETSETLQTEVPCRKQIFGIFALKIAISGLLV